MTSSATISPNRRARLHQSLVAPRRPPRAPARWRRNAPRPVAVAAEAVASSALDRIASEASRAGCVFYSRDEANRLLDDLDETGRHFDPVDQTCGWVRLLGDFGRPVAQVAEWGCDRLETSERYVVHVMFGSGDEVWSGEEVDVDVLRYSPLDLVATVAAAYADDLLEDGWLALVVDGPKTGLYF